jgi:hypothetical protein
MSEGNDALEKAVTDQGLTVDEYNRIITVAENDLQFALSCSSGCTNRVRASKANSDRLRSALPRR